MPQSGERGWPETETRQVAPEARTATATVAPASTLTGFPFTRTVTDSGMRLRSQLPRRQIRLNGDRRALAENLRADQFGRREGSSDAQAFMAGRDQNGRIFRGRADERELVRSGRAETGPD